MSSGSGPHCISKVFGLELFMVSGEGMLESISGKAAGEL